MYKSTEEDCLAVIHITKDNVDPIIEKICQRYKEQFNQESVLVTTHEVNCVML